MRERDRERETDEGIGIELERYRYRYVMRRSKGAIMTTRGSKDILSLFSRTGTTSLSDGGGSQTGTGKKR